MEWGGGVKEDKRASIAPLILKTAALTGRFLQHVYMNSKADEEVLSGRSGPTEVSTQHRLTAFGPTLQTHVPLKH